MAADPVAVAGLVDVPDEHAASANKAVADMLPSKVRRERDVEARDEVFLCMALSYEAMLSLL